MSRGASSAMKALHAGSIETAGKSALKVASSTALAADALRKTAAATAYRASKNIVSSQTHTRASMTSVNTQTLPSGPHKNPAVATSREGHRSRDCSLGTRQQPALRLFQGAARPRRARRSLLQLLKCEHTLQSVSDRRRPQTNIHSSARFAAPRTGARLPNEPQSH